MLWQTFGLKKNDYWQILTPQAQNRHDHQNPDAPDGADPLPTAANAGPPSALTFKNRWLSLIS